MHGAVDIELDLQNTVSGAVLPAAAQCRRWIAAALQGAADAVTSGTRRAAAGPVPVDGVQLTLRIVDEAESAQLNSRYRHRSGATNVLSFPFAEPALLAPPLLGDIVICAALVSREAARQGKEETAHWAHLVVHGVLHLLGFDHETDADAAAMEGVETAVLRTLGFADPYDLPADHGEAG